MIVVERLFELLHRGVRLSEIAEFVGLAFSITERPAQRQRLVEVIERLLVFAQFSGKSAERAKSVGFALPVAECSPQLPGAFVFFDGLSLGFGFIFSA